MSTAELLTPILSFLKCETPQEWIDEAIKPENLNVLLIDHLICELNDIVSKYKLFIFKGWKVEA
jgi:tRNA-(ms[2]io[6]A)-hydroxylase